MKVTDITVHGHHGLQLTIGHAVQVERGCTRVLPPATSLFNQVLQHLDRLPGVQATYRSRDEALATTAVCIRWGSYLALLADPNRPVAPEATTSSISLIADSEMMRLNVEISSALEQWLTIAFKERQRYRELVSKAVRYLPLETRVYRRAPGRVLSAIGYMGGNPEDLEIVRSRTPKAAAKSAETHPMRVIANVIANVAWRNGPVEKIHEGHRGCRFNLAERRIRTNALQAILRQASGHIGDALWGLNMSASVQMSDYALAFAAPGSWGECWGGAKFGMAKPFEWLLSGESTEVLLPLPQMIRQARISTVAQRSLPSHPDRSEHGN